MGSGSELDSGLGPSTHLLHDQVVSALLWARGAAQHPVGPQRLLLFSLTITALLSGDPGVPPPCEALVFPSVKWAAELEELQGPLGLASCG